MDSIEGKAIKVVRPGGADSLEYVDCAAAAPRADEVRIRQTAIGVNFIDVYCRTGEYKLLGEDGILGFEAAGVIEDVGADVKHLQAGDRVGYVAKELGAYASVRTMQAAWVMPMPDSLSDEQIAAVLLKGVTASYMLNDIATPSAGSTVVVHAAAGATGSLICQWASALGARVIGIVSRAEKEDFARRSRADEVIVTSNADPVEAVQSLTDGRGAEIVFDGTGIQTFEQSLAMLSFRGYLVSFGQASGSVGALDISQLAAKSIRLTRPSLFHYAQTPEQMKAYFDSLFAMIEQGKIEVTVCRSLPLGKAAEAHELLESRGTLGSVVLIAS